MKEKAKASCLYQNQDGDEQPQEPGLKMTSDPAARCLVLAELLIEAEADLAASVGVNPKDITPEAIQDAAIMAVRQAVDNIDKITFREVSDEE